METNVIILVFMSQQVNLGESDLAQFSLDCNRQGLQYHRAACFNVAFCVIFNLLTYQGSRIPVRPLDKGGL